LPEPIVEEQSQLPEPIVEEQSRLAIRHHPADRPTIA